MPEFPPWDCILLWREQRKLQRVVGAGSGKDCAFVAAPWEGWRSRRCSLADATGIAGAEASSCVGALPWHWHPHRHCRVLGLRAETCTCRTAQCGKCWKTFAYAADVSTRFHTLVRTLKTNVKIRPTLFDLLNTNHFKPPCQQKVIFPSYFYFIGKRENSLTRVFWTAV